MTYLRLISQTQSFPTYLIATFDFFFFFSLTLGTLPPREKTPEVVF